MSRRGRPSFVRRSRYRPQRVIVFLLALVLLFALRYWQEQQHPGGPEALSEGSYQVQRVVDGDTLLLTNRARIRLIGADTPETVKPNHPREPWGAEATQFTRRFIGGGTIRLQLDRERQDKYGRFLAYVWVGERMLNEELIRAGLATAETRFRYSSSMKTRFRRAEAEAEAARLGIWSSQPAAAGSL